jgi:hypothetical protein
LPKKKAEERKGSYTASAVAVNTLQSATMDRNTLLQAAQLFHDDGLRRLIEDSIEQGDLEEASALISQYKDASLSLEEYWQR